jgi:hypothetical protein
VVEQPAQSVEEQPRRLDPQPHVDELVRHRLEAADRLAELLALAGVLHASLELALHRADGAREDAASLPAHRGVEDRHPGARLAEHLAGRHLAAVEEELAHRRRPKAHLREWGADGQPGRRPLDEERRETREAAAAVGRGEDDEEIADRRIRHERLRAVQDERIAAPRRRRRQAERVRPGARLAHAVRRDQRAVAEHRQVALLLLLATELGDRRLARPHLGVEREDQPVVSARVAERLERDHDRGRVDAGAAVLPRNRQPLQPERRAALPRLVREGGVLVAIGHVLVQLGTRELDHRLTQQPLVLCQLEIDGVPPLVDKVRPSLPRLTSPATPEPQLGSEPPT